MTPKAYVGLVVVILLFVATFHGVRLLFGWSVEIGGIGFPYSISIFAFFLASLMAYQGLKLRGKM